MSCVICGAFCGLLLGGCPPSRREILTVGCGESIWVVERSVVWERGFVCRGFYVCVNCRLIPCSNVRLYSAIGWCAYGTYTCVNCL